MSKVKENDIIICAVYTRKSTEEGLDSEFSSIDAQEESCKSYVDAMKGRGWKLAPDSYNDGGFTGGNLERPAMQRLLRDIEDGKINTVVVYKHDRLTRSLIDFAKIIEIFEKHNVSFISITQEFNTTTSAGKLFLNMLFSFAQYEREIIAERTRDKIAASKKRGMWMGGMVPLGYDAIDKKLVINEEEAKIIRFIFDYYFSKKSVTEVVEIGRRIGYKTKTYVSVKKGTKKEGKLIDKGTVYQILKNKVYIGKITHKDEVYEGQHFPVIAPELFERVQILMAENEKKRFDYKKKSDPDDKSPSFLKGLIQCGGCNSGMYPTFTSKQGKQYRYYVPNANYKKACDSCPVGYISAGEIEQVVFSEVKRILLTPEIIAKVQNLVLDQDGEYTPRNISMAFWDIETLWAELFPIEQNRILRLLIQSVVMNERETAITFRESGILSLAKELQSSPAQEIDSKLYDINKRRVVVNHDNTITIFIPLLFSRRGRRKYLISPEEAVKEPSRVVSDKRLIRALAQAYKWKNELEKNKFSSFQDISEKEDYCAAHVARIMNLNFLAPDIVDAILKEDTPREIKFTEITQGIPEVWDEQRKMLGFVTKGEIYAA